MLCHKLETIFAMVHALLQNLVHIPDTASLMQTPGGYTLWFSDAQSEQSSANIRPWRSCIKSIDGKQGGQVLQGRKRSRLSSLN